MNKKSQGFMGEDDRLRKSDANDSVRGDRSEEDADRLSDGLATSDAERRAALRKDWVQEILPSVPPRSGYHRCWLSTTNANDPIHARQRVGYTPVLVKDYPELINFTLKGGAYDGAVSCNEMILFEIPMQRYLDLMTIYHHDMPLEEEESLRRKVAIEDEDKDGRSLGQVEGYDTIGKNKRPNFAHI